MLSASRVALVLIRQRKYLTRGSLRIKRHVPSSVMNDHNRGVLKASPAMKSFLQTASHFASLSIYLSTKSGMSTEELEALAADGKLRYTSGDSIEPASLSKRHLYAESYGKENEIECCNESGEWVPLTLRSAHRFYMLYNRPPDVSPKPNPRLPESWVHQIPTSSTSSVYAPFPKELINYPNTSGLTILTSDLQWQKYLSMDHAGLGTQVLFHCLPGCPQDVAENTANSIRRAYAPFHNTEFTFYRVSKIFDSSLIYAPQGDRLASGSDAAEQHVVQYAFTVDATYFPPAQSSAVQSALKEIDNITVMSREGLDLLGTGVNMGDYRHMTAREITHVERAIMRIKAHLVCGHLRACSDTEPSAE